MHTPLLLLGLSAVPTTAPAAQDVPTRWPEVMSAIVQRARLDADELVVLTGPNCLGGRGRVRPEACEPGDAAARAESASTAPASVLGVARRTTGSFPTAPSGGAKPCTAHVERPRYTSVAVEDARPATSTDRWEVTITTVSFPAPGCVGSMQTVRYTVARDGTGPARVVAAQGLWGATIQPR